MSALAEVTSTTTPYLDYWAKAARVSIDHHVSCKQIAPEQHHLNLTIGLVEVLLRAKVDGKSGLEVDAVSRILREKNPGLDSELLLSELVHADLLAAVNESDLLSGSIGEYPVIWYQNWLILKNNFDLERFVADSISKFSASVVDLGSHVQQDTSTSTDLLKNLNPEQKQAVLQSFKQRFTIITGGPGTGKTTTVTALIALMVGAGVSFDQIALCAPTGKAVQRLGESLSQRFSGNREALAHIKQATLHRLLGLRAADLSVKLQRKTELSRYKLIIVDEASMLDNGLLSELLRQLPTDCKLVLMGDVNQLGPIDVGNPFYALTQSLADTPTVCRLKQSHRFDGDSQIGQLADQLLHRDTADIVEYLQSQQLLLSHKEINSEIKQQLGGYKGLLIRAEDGVVADTEVMQASLRSKILTSHNDGEFGAVQLNLQIDRWLQQALLSKSTTSQFGEGGDGHYHGRVLMMTENNHRLGLYNGDLGICVLHQQQFHFAIPLSGDSNGSQLLQYFPMAEVRGLRPAYAITVHKSQGSEFADVLVCLSDIGTDENSSEHSFGHVNRRLLYTAVTRAKESVKIIANETTISHAINNHEADNTPLLQMLTSLVNRA